MFLLLLLLLLLPLISALSARPWSTSEDPAVERQDQGKSKQEQEVKGRCSSCSCFP